MSETIGLLLMTYGSPDDAGDVEEYLTNVRGGRQPDPEMVEEFQRRYEVIGGSPLTSITREQAAGAAERLAGRLGSGVRVEPFVGMRFFEPYVPEAVRAMAEANVSRAVALIMSPQYSPILMDGYWEDLERGLEQHTNPPEIVRVGSWWDHTGYQEAVAERIRETLDEFPEDHRDTVPLFLTAHSIPRSVWDRDPDYVDQLKDTAAAIADRLDRPNWTFAYQSAGHTREEWLEPDMTDLFPGLVEQGHEEVVIAPFQFLADHLEILYDVDIAAREQAREAGLRFHRVESLNTSPTFLDALADVAARHLNPTA